MESPLNKSLLSFELKHTVVQDQENIQMHKLNYIIDANMIKKKVH